MMIGLFNNYITPICKLTENLNDNTFFIKRDDLIPFSFGGNKTRKARYFFQKIIDNNNDCVVTYGSSSSNHCRVIANIAAKEKMPCYIISPIENNQETFNKKLMRLYRAKIINCPINEVKKIMDKTMNNLKQKGYKPYFIQGGGHGSLGTRAYVDAYREIKNYEIENNIRFDYIFHASGTGTTQAGLVCGKILNNDNKKIIGISIARKNPHGKNVVFGSINNYMKSKKKIDINEINFIDDYVLEGYSKFNSKIIKTIKDVLTEEGIPLDATYTGKAFWGMKDYIWKKQITGKNILFIHTGGTPLFFDNLEELFNGQFY